MRFLDRTCFDPAVLLPRPGPLDEHYRALGVRVFYRNLGIIKRSDSRVRQLLTLLGLPLVILDLGWFIRRNRFDLVYSNSLLTLAGGLAARLAGKKTIWRSGEFFTRPWWLRAGLYSLVALVGQRILSCSEAVRQVFPRWARHRVITLYPGVDPQRFNPHDPVTQALACRLRRELGLADSAPLIVFVGRVLPWKGVKEFVEACLRVGAEEAHYLIVGASLPTYAAYLEEVRALVEQSGRAERFHFFLNRQDVPVLLAASDLLVHSSIKPEPFGMVIAEALMMGRAVIATDCGGVPEIFDFAEQPPGVLVEPGDVPALAEAITNLLEQSCQCKEVGVTARRIALTRFNAEKLVKTQEQIYLELLSSSTNLSNSALSNPEPVRLLELSVVIVNYNGQKVLIEGLEALRVALVGISAEVFIVDNASDDRSLSLLKSWQAALPPAEQPTYQIIENRKNLGYARANNQALSQSQAEFNLLLNPDVRVEPEAIRGILQFARQHPRAGICGPRVLLSDGRLDAPCRRSFKTPASYFYKFSGLGRWFPRHPRFGKYYLSYLDETETAEVDAVIGAFLLIRRETLAETGLLDERYFAYCEDEDWCFQAKKRGWQVFYYPGAVVHHQKGSSTRQRPLRMTWEWHKSLFKFHRKNLAANYSFLTNLLIYLGILLHLGLTLALRLLEKFQPDKS